MKKLIHPKISGIVLLILMALMAVFHILVISGIVPQHMVWGGQLKDVPRSEVVMLESIAFIITLLFILIIAMRLDYIFAGKYKKVVNAGIWVIFGFMILSTLGNLNSSVTIEKLIFTPVSIISALCALRLGITKR